MHTNLAQVIAVANAYELVHLRPRLYSELSELARADEAHCGQKACLWITPYGSPAVVLGTSAPSKWVSDALCLGHELPLVVSPRRKTSSICGDFLRDVVAQETLTQILDPNRPVHIAPYIYTTQIAQLADWLVKSGFSLFDFQDQSSLIRALCDKTYVQERLFSQDATLGSLRPRSRIASTIRQLQASVAAFAAEGITRVVIKSGVAVGGAGVYFLDIASFDPTDRVDYFLRARGLNEADRTPPFIVEEWMEATSSPTVDLYIHADSCVSVCGIALQRLFDGRYYIGFHYAPEMRDRDWYSAVQTASAQVADKLHEMEYRGAVNIDFITLPNGTIRLIELNPRRSALLDGFALAMRRHGDWGRVQVSVADYILWKRTSNSSERMDRLQKNSFDSSVIPTADGSFSARYNLLSLWSSGRRSEEVLEAAVERVTGQSGDSDETESFGKLFSRVTSHMSDVAA